MPKETQAAVDSGLSYKVLPKQKGTYMDIAFASIEDLNRAYRARKLSPVEVTQAMLDRISELNPRLRAYTTITADIALEQARQAEEDFTKGNIRSLMQGIPVGIKDLCNTKGVTTGCGTTILADYIPDFDATVVSNLSKAGAVMLGKLAMTEGAYTVHHPDLQTPINPWGEKQWVGVSSSGSGAALAAGLAFAAIGTDTGGSIRLPSSANGLTGLKPTWGRVSRYGIWPLADSLDHIGPMARSAIDAGAMFNVLAGADPKDTTTLDADVPDYTATKTDAVKGITIGLDEDYVFRSSSEDTQRTLQNTLSVLQDLGAEIRGVKMPASTVQMYRNWPEYCGVEAAIAHQDYYPSRKDQYGPVLAQLIETGRRLTATDIMTMHHHRLEFSGALNSIFSDIDLIIAPVHPFGNPTNADLAEILKTSEGVEGALRFTAPFDMSGSPTITLQGGESTAGHPIGFQLIGRHLDEALLISIGYAFQQHTDWHDHHPAL